MFTTGASGHGSAALGDQDASGLHPGRTLHDHRVTRSLRHAQFPGLVPAVEAIAYRSAIQSAQERHIAREGFYATNPKTLDISLATPKHFRPDPTITATQASLGTATWTMTLTRIAGSSSYGAYAAVFTQDGYDVTNSTIPASINPVSGNSRDDDGS